MLVKKTQTDENDAVYLLPCTERDLRQIIGSLNYNYFPHQRLIENAHDGLKELRAGPLTQQLDSIFLEALEATKDL